MELGILELILLPVGLGLLGFIEPCTIGGHLLFLNTQNDRSRLKKIHAVLTFIVARSVVAGAFGASIAFLGQRLISLQTGFWFIFGAVYLLIGLTFLAPRSAPLLQRIDLAPAAWKSSRSPLSLGLGFGLNIPACAAPILFGLLGLAATAGTMLAGFWMMFLFGLALSSPLAVFAAVPRLASSLETLGAKMKRMPWLVGIIFALLGIWSIWFGLHVDPANWAGK